jgi:hypothetical protein
MSIYLFIDLFIYRDKVLMYPRLTLKSILFPQPPMRWYYRHRIPHPAHLSFLYGEYVQNLSLTWWLMPIIPVTWEAEIRLKARLGKKLARPPSQ